MPQSPGRIEAFNARVPWPLRLLLVVGVGLLLFRAGQFTYYAGWAATAKLRHRAPSCDWPRVLTVGRDLDQFNSFHNRFVKQVSIEQQDRVLDIARLRSPKGPFWIRRSGENRDGPALLAYLLAEQEWFGQEMPGRLVKAGDVVMDCGAHVGVFTHKALELGAAKVVAIEPDPINRECFRRNFAPELASGRVVLVEKGIWDREGTLKFSSATANSAMGSFVHDEGGASVELPVTTIDTLVRELGLARLDYIKMDIEGSERRALRGGLETLRRFRPRIMLDSYHEPDDTQVLPAILREAHADYQETCGPCQPIDGAFVSHMIFFQ